jgi:hypothetical protein
MGISGMCQEGPGEVSPTRSAGVFSLRSSKGERFVVWEGSGLAAGRDSGASKKKDQNLLSVLAAIVVVGA